MVCSYIYINIRDYQFNFPNYYSQVMEENHHILKFVEIIQSKANAFQFPYEVFVKKKTIIFPHCRFKDALQSMNTGKMLQVSA